MKGNYLGEFQEIVLLIILILGENAYGVTLQKEIKERLQRDISRGALHTASTRLEEKGFIRSELRGATSKRGGRRKRFFVVTHKGQTALHETKNIRDQLWQAIPNLSLKISNV